MKDSKEKWIVEVEVLLIVRKLVKYLHFQSFSENYLVFSNLYMDLKNKDLVHFSFEIPYIYLVYC